MKCSEVRSVNAMILMLVVLSVQFKKYTRITRMKSRDIMGQAEAVGYEYRSRSHLLTKET